MLRGKNVIITGANRGIGHTLLVMLAKSGANIWACCRKSNSSFEEEIACLAAENRVWIKPVYFELTDSNSMYYCGSAIYRCPCEQCRSHGNGVVVSNIHRRN